MKFKPEASQEGRIVKGEKFEEINSYFLCYFISVQFISYVLFLLLVSFCVEKRLVLTIEPKDYISKDGAGGSIKLYLKGDVEETGQSFATQDVVQLKKPVLKVTVSYCDNKLQLLMMINRPGKRS